MGATLTGILPALQEHYADSIKQVWVGTDKTINPILASMEIKAEDDGMGRGYIVPIEYGFGSSASATFTTAQAKAAGATTGSAALRDRWVVQAVEKNAVAVFSRQAIDGAKGDKGKAFDVITREIDSKIALIRDRIAMDVLEAGWGRAATIQTSGVSTVYVTVGTSAINRFQVGDDLQASSSIDGAVLRNSGTALTVVGINTDTGVLTMSANAASASWADGDIVFKDGDRENSSSPTKLCVTGLAEWVPTTAPTTALWGVTRTGIPALGGLRLDCSGFSDHSTALIKAAMRLQQYRRKADTCFVSCDDYAILAQDKEAVKTVTIELGPYKIGFDALKLATPAGSVNVVADSFLEQGKFYMGPFNDPVLAPKLIHNKGDSLVNIDDHDGNMFLRTTTTNYESRLYFRGNIAMACPGAFLVGYGLVSS